MTSSFSDPATLIQALLDRRNDARTQFQDWLREPVHRLMLDLLQRHHLDLSAERLTQHALHSAETYLRSRSVGSFARVSWRALRATLLLHLAKQAHQPFGGDMGNDHAPAPLPGSEQYRFQTLFLPFEKVGSFWYGGDWFGGMRTKDGSLWVIVADVTGHGYYAYLLATTLPGIWEKCWDRDVIPDDPHAVLGDMHDLLSNCLPDGTFVECTLLRLEPSGKATIAPAGATRLLVRNRKQHTLHLVKLRGLWLGLDPPCEEDQHVVNLSDGDELVIGSDGVFDQLATHVGASENLVRLLEQALNDGSLLDAIERALQAALKDSKQKDDITLVQIQRRSDHAELSVNAVVR